MSLTVSLIIPTYNAQNNLTNNKSFEEVISRNSTLVIDSSSTDSTLEMINHLGARVIVIPKDEFNHGATRELGRRQCDSDIVVYCTQDVIPTNHDLIEKLVEPLLCDSAIAVSYARQIPHDGANVFEAFPREYNYGTESQVRGIEDVDKYGVYTFFCSNSCAAYRNSALDEIGGFKPVLTNEDYFAVAELLQKGYKIAYVADAIVKHSHHYTLWQEFQRYFDTGYVRAENPSIQQLVGRAESRGVGFVAELLRRVWRDKPLLLPYAILQSLVKWLGYRVGFYGAGLPLWLKKMLSQQSYYWDSKYYKK